MALFQLENKRVKPIYEKTFKKEKDVQQLVENNLTELMNLDFVKTEFAIGKFRLDTLAYNSETASFVIIEYKKTKNESLVDQGYTYLNIMLEQKAAFVLAFNEVFPYEIKAIKDIDWSQSRVVFISPVFSSYQKGAASNPQLPIDLIQVKSFEKNLIEMEEITKTNYIADHKKENLESVNKLNKEIKVYTEEDLISKGNEESQALYHSIKQAILDWDPNIQVTANKHYVSFKRKTNFCDIAIQKKQVKIWLNAKVGDLDDSQNVFRDVTNIGHYGNGDYEVSIQYDTNVEYILSVIKQAWMRGK
ncbi:DUF5655 domain-containing protein [Tetragenococcus halophilus]|uniref:DUF5655 domain-containing protein n=1 Tax=Tetragenococcus halophilus TaxID=51669 RepID=UPI001B5420DA|nr:DUF5655 domain-containing protein [Tetragenococcus halophilus]GFK29297.1 hypothetical protein YG2_17310 [Tetragenococcus halophilus]